MSLTKKPSLALVVRDGPAVGREITVGRSHILGRGEGCSVRLPDVKMSRRHVRIEPKRRRLLVEDLSSNNGTWVNGKRIHRAKLRPGDRLRIGKTVMELVDGITQDSEPTVLTTGPLNRILTLHDFTPAKIEAMPTQEFLQALGLGGDSDEFLATIDDDVLATLRGERRNFAIVYNVAKALQEALDLTSLLRTAVSFVFKVTRAERCYVLLVDSDTGELEPRLARHRDTHAGPIPIELSGAITEQVMADGNAVISYDAAEDPRFQSRQSVIGLGMHAVMCVPIPYGTEVLGLVHLDQINSPAPFGDQDFELVTVIASLLGLRIQNLRLIEKQAQTILALREAQDELVRRERLAVLGRLTSGLAHEMSNLLMPFSLTRQLVDEHEDDEELVDVLELMDEGRLRIITLLHEVRMIAKGGDPDLQTSEQSLRETVESVVRFGRCDGGIRQHEIVVHEDEPLAPFRFDPGSLKQVLLNLIRNAAQALNDPGTIEIRIELEPGATPTACVHVIDQGPGIRADQLARIWEPFFSTKSSGSGLGLDISRRIIERHGGTLTCASQLGRGTTMSVRLPIFQVAEAAD